MATLTKTTQLIALAAAMFALPAFVVVAIGAQSTDAGMLAMLALCTVHAVAECVLVVLRCQVIRRG